MNKLPVKTKQSTSATTIKSIMQREKISATKLAKDLDTSDQALRARLRGDSKFPADEFLDILKHLGYKINIVKEEDIL